ncbi:MAG: DDE-type integrase/transposase/recombinase [Spirochaetia bacterium]|nr:DDE-type integrase/transposase/recombinase [Spirochaetia bacterium]
MRVLGAIDSAQGKTQQERVENVAEMVFVDEYGYSRKFTWRTIYTWLYRYQNHGMTGVQPKIRSDKGQPRKVSPEDLLAAISEAKKHFRLGVPNRMALYRKIIEMGLMRREEVAPTTFYRLIHEHDLLGGETEGERPRMAFAMKYANELWQGDTMFGPFVRDEKNTPVQSKLVAFIDDASRVLCHGQFFLRESTDELVAVLRAAFYKRGIPQNLYVDNGAIYSSKEITLICARVGCILGHAPLRDGASKGKIERFFRTVRLKFLTRNLDLSNLAALNRQFTSWVEDEYNHVVHSGIGMKPIDRFGLDRNRIRFLPNLEANDEVFFTEKTRTVINNNTFSFQSAVYEAPAVLQNKKIEIRFDRHRKDSPVIVYFKGERIGEARPVDLIANGRLRREKRQENPEIKTQDTHKE